jgi:hypothetical protein
MDEAAPNPDCSGCQALLKRVERLERRIVDLEALQSNRHGIPARGRAGSRLGRDAFGWPAGDPRARYAPNFPTICWSTSARRFATSAP